jgi:hypothetical protein
MSYTYLFETYAFIKKRVGDVQQKLVDSSDDNWKARQYAAGQIESLSELERFLSSHYDAKLPHRLLRHRSDPHR